MLELLSKISIRKLEQLVGRRELRASRSIADNVGERTSESLARILLALNGREILSKKEIRSAIFETIPSQLLKGLTEELVGHSLSANSDNAAILAAMEWRPNNKLVVAMRDILSIEERYLPSIDRTQPMLERLLPIGEIPPLHKYQENVVNSVIENVNAGRSMLVQMPTGSGKSRTAAEALVRFCETSGVLQDGKSVLWVAHSEELCEQAVSAIRKVWVNKAKAESKLVRLWAGRNPSDFEVSGGIVVASYQTLASICSRKTSLQPVLREVTSCIILDEAHMATATTYREAVESISNLTTVRIGLTATPGRGAKADNENKQLAKFFDNRLISPPEFEGNAVNYLREKGVLARCQRYIIETGFKVETQKAASMLSDLPTRLLDRLSESRERNALILDSIQKEVEDGMQILVFSCSVKHSVLLTIALLERGVSAAYVDSSVGGQRRREIVADFSEGKLPVLINFGVLSTGFDVPNVNTIIITRPTSSVVLYSQMVGRGLRGPKMGGSEFFKLIDVKDHFTKYGGVEAVYDIFEDYWS